MIFLFIIGCEDAPVVYLLVIIQVGSSGNLIAGFRLVVARILFLLLVVLASSSSYDKVTLTCNNT